MSSIGTGYDLAASSFSPDGRIFQVEYAQKAVDNCGTIIAIAAKDGVVTAVDRAIHSKLIVETANPRVMHVNDYIGFTSAGVYPDAQSLLDYCQEETLNYLKEYRAPIPIKKLSQVVSEYMHIFTLGLSRPFGAAAFLTAYNESEGSSVFLIEPSGLAYQYKAWAIGKNRQAAKTEIEKLDLSSLSLEQAVKEAARILITCRDESKQKNQRIEMGWVGANTNGHHDIVPSEIVSNAEEWAQSLLNDDDSED